MKAALVHSVVHALGRLPLPIGQALGTLIGWLALHLPWRGRRVARENIDLCFSGLDAAARDGLVRASMLHAGRTFTDSAWVWTRPAPAALARIQAVHGLDRLEAARDAGRGIIFASPHIGCWELVAPFVASQVPTTILFRRPRMAALEPVLARARARSDARRLVPADAGGVRALHRALQAGEAIGILPDQAPRDGRGIIAPFFGRPALTMTLLTRLVRRHRPVVLYTVMERLPRGRGFELHLLPASDELGNSDDIVAATALNRDVERCIRLCPAQYMWTYRRFRRQRRAR